MSLAFSLDPSAEVVVAHHRHHGGALAQKAQVVGNVAAHAAQGGGHMAGIGVPGHQGPWRIPRRMSMFTPPTTATYGSVRTM